jgi:hypothetical protein
LQHQAPFHETALALGGYQLYLSPLTGQFWSSVAEAYQRHIQ